MMVNVLAQLTEVNCTLGCKIEGDVLGFRCGQGHDVLLLGCLVDCTIVELEDLS
jgi:hypothetical protein